MQRRTLAKWLVFTALVCFGLFLAAGIAAAQEGNVVQGQNGSAASEATSETADASNDLTFRAGPSADGLDAPAQAAQNGDNVAHHGQHASARSGDAAAGSQVLGAVGNGATIQAQSSSDGAVAVSGPAAAFNTAEVFIGPNAISDGAAAQVSQSGDNRLDATQTAVAITGDAVAGAQVTGLVGEGDRTVSLQNNALDPIAETGEVEVENDSFVTLGPSAATEDEAAQASQVGDNDLVLRQAVTGRSGDALAGAQVTGGVGDGSATTQGQSSSTDAESTSGDVFALNVIDTIAIGPAATTGGASASASQVGDNTADIDQDIRAGSGDAIAGSQVLGLVSEETGHINVQNQQSSDGDIAESGSLEISNEILDVFVGPIAEALDAPAQSSQNGDNDLSLSQHATAASGDAVAGSQVTGVVGGGDVTVQNQNASIDSESISGEVVADVANSVDALVVGPFAVSDAATAAASQSGDNALALDQTADLSSGDAIAGSQVTGAVSDPSGITVQAQNSSDGAVSESGVVEADVVNEVSDLTVGPAAESLDETAAASQIGDNDITASQDATLATGDAVAGSQVTGVVGDHADVTVQIQNTSVDDEAISGDVAPGGANLITAGAFGPVAISDAAPALASQNGDNDVAIEQSADLVSGDAVAGAQVTGIVASGGETTVQSQNTSDASASASGEVSPDVANTLDTFGVGPFATTLDEAAQASQVGDGELAFVQDADASSGDAVAGAQVAGVVASGSDVTVQNQSTSIDSEAVSGDAAVDALLNLAEEVQVGPFATADAATASATQNGDAELDVVQEAEASTGDAVAGAQVSGIVADGADVTVQNSNSAEAALAETGPSQDGVIANELSVVFVGPVAEAIDDNASASQVGDDEASIEQSSVAASGDAVAGAQVTGVVAHGGEVTVQNQNSSIDAETLTGEVIAENIAEEIQVGPAALGDFLVASASQFGDDTLVLGQAADASSGDAIAGAQITGVVQDDSTVQLQNFDDGSLAESLEAGVLNTATGNVGPLASAEDGDANAAQLGDTDLVAGQNGEAATGDVVAGAQVTGLAA